MGFFESEQSKADHLVAMKKFHHEAVEPYLGRPKGCRSEAIVAMEKNCGFDLPIAYRQYLSWMGNDKNGIFKGTECFVDNVAGNTEWLPKLLAENKIDFHLPAHYLAFFSHQGYRVAWFELPKTSEDPSVWLFSEGDGKMPTLQRPFTEWILRQMRTLAPLLPQLYPKLS